MLPYPMACIIVAQGLRICKTSSSMEFVNEIEPRIPVRTDHKRAHPSFSNFDVYSEIFFSLHTKMPRGLRKRGRRHKNKETEDYPQGQDESYAHDGMEENNHELNQDQGSHTEPSWIIPAASRGNDETVNPEAPFGFVDAEVKAYFRTVDVQIRDWQENQGEDGGADGDVDVDPNEGALIPFVVLSDIGEVFMCMYTRTTNVFRCGVD